MTITLTYDGTTLPLDEDLLWVDELQAQGVTQTVDDSLTGSLIVQVDGDADKAGQNITLQPEDDESAWMIRDDMVVLKAWANIAGAQFDLVLRGVTYRVMFRHQEKPAFDAKAVTHFSDAIAGDYYLPTFKFMTV